MSARARASVRLSSSARRSFSSSIRRESRFSASTRPSSTSLRRSSASRSASAPSSATAHRVSPAAAAPSPRPGPKTKAIHAPRAATPQPIAAPLSSVGGTRCRRTPTNDAATRTAAPAKTAWKTRSAVTARPPYTCSEKERESERGRRSGEQLKRALRRSDQGLGIDRLARSVVVFDCSRHRPRLPADGAHDRRQPPLREAEQEGVGRDEERLRAQLARFGEVGGQRRECSPGEREPDRVVEEASAELEVVRGDDERTEGDEGEQPQVVADCAQDADPDRSGDRHRRQGDQRAARDSRLQRPPHQFVEGVRADPDSEEEGAEQQPELRPVEPGGDRGSDRDIAQVPDRVRRVEERDVVAPSAGAQGVEGRPRLGGHALRPQITMPPPRLSRRTRMSSTPASRHRESWRSSGSRS